LFKRLDRQAALFQLDPRQAQIAPKIPIRWFGLERAREFNFCLGISPGPKIFLGPAHEYVSGLREECHGH
jgi:hypothetical protein